ncbi:MAG: hypothetical protein SOX65_02650 [Porphyromonas sp.]|uniref:hypothetical protein n=1 Tax=Porphyromonas sp. TaxID=1924944 RepID=UPI002A83D908|nr:hypothetical protein [Porphyromonas sp.]MDY4245362.1 hypothetical protein [Porphyromonas sp.]
MTQTTQTTQQAEQATQQTTSQPAETTQQASQQPTASNEPTAKSQEPAKSAFISDGKLPQQAQPTANSQQPKANEQPRASNEPTANSQELTAQITALQARLDAIESQRTTETRTAEVERIIAPLSDTLKAVYRRTPFATLTDEEFTQLRETISKEVTELATADKPRGAVFSRPTASKPTDGKASDKETDEVLRRLNL